MELILAAAGAAAGGAALAAACWRSPRGACVCLGLTAAAMAVPAAVHDAGAAAAVLLVHAAVGLAALTTGALPGTGGARRRRVVAAAVVLAAGSILAMALGIAAAEGPSPPYPPRGVTLVLALGGLLLLSAVVGINALSRGRAAAGPAPGKAS